MKIKSIYKYFNNIIFVVFVKIIYRRNLRRKLIKNIPKISSKYRKEIKKYWRIYNLTPNLGWHRFYSFIYGEDNLKYIPEDIFHAYIEPYFNNFDLRIAYSNKAIYDTLFSNLKRPVTLAKNMNGILYDSNNDIITLVQLFDICKMRSKLVVKPSIDSGGGRNVFIISSENSSQVLNELSNIINNHLSSDFVIQEYIEQHENLSNLYSDSVNTIRVISLFYNNKVYILSSYLRLGRSGSKVDNTNAGGLICGITNTGLLKEKAYSRSEKKFYSYHPDTG